MNSTERMLSSPSLSLSRKRTGAHIHSQMFVLILFPPCREFPLENFMLNNLPNSHIKRKESKDDVVQPVSIAVEAAQVCQVPRSICPICLCEGSRKFIAHFSCVVRSTVRSQGKAHGPSVWYQLSSCYLFGCFHYGGNPRQDAFSKTASSPHATTSLDSNCNEMPTALQRSYLGVVSFGVVATYFHAMGIDEMGSDPRPFYSCYFSAVGAFILYWHARGLIDLLACPDVRKNVAVRTASIRRAKAHFLCLGVLPLVLCRVLPLVLCLTGASHAVNRFLFNGYGSFHATVGMDPLLGQAITYFPGKNAFKLKTLRLLLPTIGLSYVVESILVETFQIDPHAIVHVLAMSYVLLMHSCLSSLPRSNESSKSS
jgi:hypothetical protein